MVWTVLWRCRANGAANGAAPLGQRTEIRPPYPSRERPVRGGPFGAGWVRLVRQPDDGVAVLAAQPGALHDLHPRVVDRGDEVPADLLGAAADGPGEVEHRPPGETAVVIHDR